jgi:streptogramin lyase
MPERSAGSKDVLVVTDFGADTVTFVDPSRRGEAADLGSVTVGAAPYGIVLGADGTAWVATAAVAPLRRGSSYQSAAARAFTRLTHDLVGARGYTPPGSEGVRRPHVLGQEEAR